MNLEPTRGVWWCSVDAPALILGSTQSDTDINRQHAQDLGLSIVQRRSGGGIVYVHPDDSMWIDITIPRGDPLWTDDVSTSMLWLGEVFVEALQPWVSAEEYRGAFDIGVDGRAVCFASTSPGEVFVGKKKVVGISQRRNRDGARFQCVLYRRWAPDHWVSALADREVAQRVTHLPVATVDVSGAEVLEQVHTALRSR